MYYYIDKELNMAAVMNIFNTSVQHCMTIGEGLNVETADLIERRDPDKLKLRIIFQRWFDADRNVNWGALEKLCDENSAELGKAKNKMLTYLGKFKT